MLMTTIRMQHAGVWRTQAQERPTFTATGFMRKHDQTGSLHGIMQCPGIKPLDVCAMLSWSGHASGLSQ